MGEARFVGPKTVEVTLNDGGTRLLRGDQRLPRPRHARLCAAHSRARRRGDDEHRAARARSRARRTWSSSAVATSGSSSRRPIGASAAASPSSSAGRSCSTARIRRGRGDAAPVRRRGDRGPAWAPRPASRRPPGRAPRRRAHERRRAHPRGERHLGRARGGRRTRRDRLDVAGVDLDGRGYIAVNERLETSAPDVWAIGECAGSPQFTHVSTTTFASCATTSAGSLAPRAGVWSPSVCSPIRRSRASA